MNVTRAYSSNSGDESPFGHGWSLSADVRSTAGGLLTGPAAPIRSVPVNFQERPPKESDPNVATQPVAAVTSTSSSGKQETIQKDVDGVLTTPPWDNNVSNPTYQEVTLNGSQYQVQSGNQTTTLDGTVYTYSLKGSYPNGNLPYNASQISPAPTPTHSNVLKVTQATDRQGNVTNYVYNQSTWVTFNKMDGQTQEHPLSSVNMPNGHTITFTWGNGSNAPTNRIVSITDGTRTVQYTYTNGNLTGVTTPGGKTTLYGYGSATVPQGWTGDTATNLLTSTTTPQGLTTSVVYQMDYMNVSPYQVTPGEGVEVYSETLPNGCYVDVGYLTSSGVTTNTFAEFDSGNNMWNQGAVEAYDSGGQFTVSMNNTGAEWTNDILGQHGYYWQKSYDQNSENLLTEIDYIVIPYSNGPQAAALHYLRGYGPNQSQTLTTTTAYNFAGNPLSKTVLEATTAMPGYTAPANHSTTMSYAYWGPAEYYAQMGTMDAGGRYTYTSYYPNTAAAGSRGQKYQVFDQAHAGFYLNQNITPPSYAVPADYWKYQLTPTAGQYTAQFAYDSVGRCTNVYQLHSSTTNPWTYVQTQTTYGSNADGSWGQAKEVVEDVGGIGRTTQTLQYTAWGKANEVLDAAGHQFNTVFDLDGNVQTVTRVDSGLNQTIASYTYGPTAGTVSYGQVTSVTDGLSGVSDSVSYQPSGGGVGEMSGTTETNGSSTSSVGYSYDLAGNRSQTTYTTPNGTELWGYFDYVPIGSPEGIHRGFQTLNKLTSGGSRSSEEMHYAFDSGGRLYCAAFAQTPQSGQSGYQTEAAASRCRTDYIYDPAGRVLGVENYWDTYNGSGFNVEAVLANDCQYEYTNLNRGLKTSSSFYKNTAEGSSSWTLDHTETYSYDPSRDFLTGANYGDGLPNQTPSWTYDAAQNRTDSVVDNLNRTTSIGGVATSCDILGNRLTDGSNSYGWDCLNRMTSYNGSANSYVYRADGMRVSKVAGSTSTVYRYDGQMGFEDVDTTGSAVKVTDYGLGARGIDYISATQSGTTTAGFPIYDAHGNMTACIFRYGTNYYSINNQRHYDAWGVIRSGAATGDPKGRYCARLGHKQDDESGLVYMRARYFESGSGRFISEDPKLSGANWFAYCRNNPVNLSDSTGKDDSDDADSKLGMAVVSALITLGCLVAAALVGCVEAKLVAWSGLLFLAAWFGMELTPFGQSLTLSQRVAGFTVASTFTCG